MDLISGPVDQTSSPQAKIACFGRSSEAATTCTRGDSRAARRAGLVTLPPVPTSGSVACARSRASNALNVPTVGSFRSLTTSFAGTCQVATPRDSPSSLASTRCFRTRPASSLPSISTRPAGTTMPRRFLTLVATSISSRARTITLRARAHVWFFFEEAIPAALARRLGSHVLTETMERRPDIGLDSATGCFRIKTRCRKEDSETSSLCRSRGRRANRTTPSFDGAFVPWADQWAFLASVRKIGRPQVEQIVEDAERRGRILGVRLPPQDDGETEPWTAPPSRHRRESPIVGVPSTLELVLGNQITSPKACIPGFEIACCGWPRFRSSSTKRRRCGFRHAQATRHRVRRGSPASHRTAARLRSMTFARCSPILVFARSFATNVATAVVWR